MCVKNQICNNQQLQEKCKKYRKQIISIVAKNNIGHLGGTLSIVEIMVYLYYGISNNRRVHIVLSKGHSVLIQYIILKDLDIIKDDISDFGMLNSIYETHPKMGIPGIEFPSGSLGQGISGSVGMALAYKYKKEEDLIFTIVGDGELNEGEVWEAFHTIINYQLYNLVVIIDVNDYQLDGSTSDFFKVGRLKQVLSAMGFHIEVCDGNNLDEIKQWEQSLSWNIPNILLMKTIKGKGISFMENNNDYHSSFWKINGDIEFALKETE